METTFRYNKGRTVATAMKTNGGLNISLMKNVYVCLWGQNGLCKSEVDILLL
jgi:hypothetical protein